MIEELKAPLPTLEPHFSPHQDEEGCEAAVIAELAKAHKSVYVRAYSFTSEPIATALIDAHKRGVLVELVLDPTNAPGSKTSQGDRCHHAGIPIVVDHKHAISHNKVMIIDGKVVLNGSFNFTGAAEHHNAENLLVIRDADVAAKYKADYDVHQAHSVAWGHDDTAARKVLPDDEQTRYEIALDRQE
jgi:phosphatidylserine/phosphatidylglycerophosphate/cardiolipin synthase-like enzyme